MTSPVFVVGTPRSGTTLTARMLGSHPNIFTAGEFHFISDVYDRRSALGNPRDPAVREEILNWLTGIYARHNEPKDQYELDQLLKQDNVRKRFLDLGSYQEMYSFVMDTRAARANKARWGNHVPKDIYNTNEIFSFFPDAKLIACVRDPRDFLASYKNRHRSSAPEFRERLTRLYHPILTTLLWKSTVRLIRRLQHQIPSNRLLLLRYEDLISMPESHARRICEYLGEPFDSAMLNISDNNSSKSGQQPEGIFTSSLHRWREDLDADEVCLTQWIASSEMVQLGYKPEQVDASWKGIAGLALTSPFAALRAVRETRQDRGGLIPYLRKRIRPYWQRG